MKTELMEILVCPMCRGSLDLSVTTQKDEEIVEGVLTCTECAETYPITNTIPNMLPPSLRDS